ncbi:MAG: glycosyltransferase [Desulfobacteraceae bacterium]|nr:glycosyltransferase [Desulfobacteraceae bacterium]
MGDASKTIEIHIAFELVNQATGGGNQFLKALKRYFQSNNLYQEDLPKANVVLFNSHQHIDEIAKMKLRYSNKIFVQRIDGPMRLYNKLTDKRDHIAYLANKYLADATIFQSRWSREQNYKLGLHENISETTISNTSDPSIFNRNEKVEFSTQRKIRLIATSWSRNWNRGFKVYKWLDENLDYNKYQMVFIGNSPVVFNNIQHIYPLKSEELTRYLKKSDIFITASQKDPCSNSLIEALHCGLPAVGFRDGGHPQIIGKGGVTFTRGEEIPILLEKIIKNYHEYQANITVPSIEEVGRQYYDFMTEVYNKVQSGRQKNKSFGLMDYITAQTQLCYLRLCGFIGRLLIKQP